MSGIRGLVAQGISPQDDLKHAIEDQRLQNLLVSRINGLAQQVISAGALIAENQPSKNGLLLLAGTHNGFTLSKAGTAICGVPAAFVGGSSTFSAQCVVYGVQFLGQVSIGANAVVTFTNCQFSRNNAAALVAVSSGGQAVFIGCTFTGSGLSQVVDNPGSTSNIRWGGCFNLTGAADGNVTTGF